METHGFGESSYDAASFAKMMGAANPDFMAAGPTDWQPFPLANSTRVAFLEAGKGVACGVLGSNPNSTLLSFAANSGSVNRFDYIIARFNWATGDVVLMVLPGGTTPPPVNTTQSVNSAQVNRIPGVMFDGIIAQVRVRPGVTQFNADDVVDKRVWQIPHGNGMVASWRQGATNVAPNGSAVVTGMSASVGNGPVPVSYNSSSGVFTVTAPGRFHIRVGAFSDTGAGRRLAEALLIATGLGAAFPTDPAIYRDRSFVSAGFAGGGGASNSLSESLWFPVGGTFKVQLGNTTDNGATVAFDTIISVTYEGV